MPAAPGPVAIDERRGGLADGIFRVEPPRDRAWDMSSPHRLPRGGPPCPVAPVVFKPGARGAGRMAEDPPRPDGDYSEKFADGSLAITGRYKGGKKTGDWVYYHKGGKVKATGAYRDDKFQGPWTWWHPKGEKLQEGAFDRGQQVGPWRRWHPNGKLQDEGEYVAGKKVGVWKTYKTDGTLKEEVVHDASG